MKIASLFVAGLALLSIAAANAAPAAPDNTAVKPGNVGCGVSSGAQGSGCRNVLGFKTYSECLENRMQRGWRQGESGAYCASLGLK
jgi:hypothetical protein